MGNTIPENEKKLIFEGFRSYAVEEHCDKKGLRCKDYFEMQKLSECISLSSNLKETLDKLRLPNRIISTYSLMLGREKSNDKLDR